jgi:hypothetical protein
MSQEQLAFKQTLQYSERLRGGRLADAHGLGGAFDRLQLGHRDEDVQVSQSSTAQKAVAKGTG